jgi:DNA-binding transcriptional MerR regulator
MSADTEADAEAKPRRRLKIGELAKTANISTRLIRYYEEQALIESTRAANGYREYDLDLVDRVWQIRGLLESGIPVRIIKDILPFLDDPCEIHLSNASPELLAAIQQQYEQMDRRVRVLTRNRDALAAYLEAVRGSAPV